MSESKHVIWQDIDIDVKDFEDFLEEEYPDVTDEYEQLRLCQEMNDEYLYDEMANMKKDVQGRIVIIADLGLWYGKRAAYKVIDSTNLADVLKTDDGCDYHEFYVEDGELRGRAIHHDGTNLYVFRALYHEIDDDLYDTIINDIASRDQLYDATRSLAPDVCSVYGWDA